jgi:serine protease inhibitor
MTKYMKQKGKFNYYTSEELRAHVLQMPYKGDDISMIIILPPFEDDALYTTVQKMTPETIQGVMAEVRSGFYEVDDLTVEIPKFKIEQSLELSDTLSKLGASFLG